MSDLLYYFMNILPYLVAAVQCVMYIFVIVLIARATTPLVKALKAYAAKNAPEAAPVHAEAPAFAQQEAAAEQAAETEQKTEE